MAEESWPYAGVAVNEERWRAMSRLWRRTGVVADVDNELAVTAVGAALQVSVASGEAWIDGHYYANGSAATLNLATADLNDDRIDLVVVRSTAEDEAVLAVITGTPSGSPVAPTPTQDHEGAGVYELPLAEVLVEAASGEAGMVTDRRQMSLVPSDYVEALATVETDTDMVLKPDGAGGVAFGSATSSSPILLPAGAFLALTGSPTTGTAGSSQAVWLLDAAATEIIGTSFEPPSDWTTMDVALVWARAGGTTPGDVVIVVYLNELVEGAGYGSTVGNPQTVAASTTANASQTTTIHSGVPAVRTLVRAARAGADAADTLTNDIGVIGVLFTKAT